MKNSFKGNLKAIINYFTDENIPMEAKKFYLVVLYLCPVVLIMCILNPLVKLNYIIILVTVFYLLITIAMTYLVWRFREFKRISIFFCLFTSLVFFPMLFLMSDGIFGTMPMFLTASVILSFFLIDGITLWFAVGIQYAFYCIFFAFVHMNKELLDEVGLYKENMFMRNFDFIFACLIPILIIFQKIVAICLVGQIIILLEKL